MYLPVFLAKIQMPLMEKEFVLYMSKEISSSIYRQSIHHDICPVVFKLLLQETLGLGDNSRVQADAVQGSSGFDQELNLPVLIQIYCHAPLFLAHLAQLPSFYLALDGAQFSSAGTLNRYLLSSSHQASVPEQVTPLHYSSALFPGTQVQPCQPAVSLC